MDDTTAASVGYVLAGVALVTSFAGWFRALYEPEVAVVGGAFAGIAFGAFALRRFGRLDRPIAAVVAATGAIGAAAATLSAGSRSGIPLTALVVVVTAGASAVFAYADWTNVGRDALAAKSIATVRSVAIGAMGILGIYAWAIVAFLLAGAVMPSGLGRAEEIVLSTLASGAGTITVVALYLRWSDRDVSFLDLHAPDLTGIGYVVGGTLVILGGNLAIGLTFQRFGIDSASHTIVQTAEADPSILLALIPLSYLVIAPGEELLYRNVVQKSLRETFSPVAGVVVASAIFAAVHLPAYSSPDSSFLATLSTLGIIFVLAIVLGAIYERTRNVVVPILVHGSFNAIAFAATYAELTGAVG